MTIRMTFQTILKTACLLGGVAMMAIPAEAQWKRVDSRVTVSAGSCSGCDLSGKDMHGLRLKNANFSGSLFNRANLSGGEFYGADLRGAHFKKAFLARLKGEGVILQGANLTDATLTESDLVNCILTGASLNGADLARGSFRQTNFNGANLSGSKALGTDFTGSHFVQAEFDNANLTGAVFKDAVLKNAAFGKANLHGANLEGANLSGAKLSTVKGLKQAQLDTSCGDGATELPFGLSVSYCAENLTELEMSHNGDHLHLKAKDQYIAQRVDQAITNVEGLMSTADASTRRELQKVHSDLRAVRRAVEE